MISAGRFFVDRKDNLEMEGRKERKRHRRIDKGVSRIAYDRMRVELSLFEQN